MKKILLSISLFALFLIGTLFTISMQDVKAGPTTYCFWNPYGGPDGLGDCDTGGNCVCYDIYPPNCSQLEPE